MDIRAHTIIVRFEKLLSFPDGLAVTSKPTRLYLTDWRLIYFDQYFWQKCLFFVSLNYSYISESQITV